MNTQRPIPDQAAPHDCLRDASYCIAVTGEGAYAEVVHGGWPAMLAGFARTIWVDGDTSHNPEEWAEWLETLCDRDEWLHDEANEPSSFSTDLGETAHVSIYRLGGAATAPFPVLPAVPAQRWISVEDHLPVVDTGEVLVWLTGARCAFDEWHTHREDPTGMGGPTMDMGPMWRDYDFEEITHWMRLPEAPGAAPPSVPAQRLTDEEVYECADRHGFRFRTADEECMQFDKHAVLAFAHDILRRAAPPPAEAAAPDWGYAKTVANTIAQLQTMDPALPLYGAFHLEDGRCTARGLIFSRERVVDGRWIRSSDESVPYSIVAWTASKEPERYAAEAAASPDDAQAPAAMPDTMPGQCAACGEFRPTTNSVALRALDDVEAMLGGRNGPTIQIRSALAAAPDAPAAQPDGQSKRWCETCEGVGIVDERLGGYWFSDPKAECPDCNGKGWWLPSAAAPAAQPDDFTDTGRAALLWVLWHHQGGSSPVGQPIRFALGMGQHDRLSESQLAQAKFWRTLVSPPAAQPVEPTDEFLDLMDKARKLMKEIDAAGTYSFVGLRNSFWSSASALRNLVKRAAPAAQPVEPAWVARKAELDSHDDGHGPYMEWALRRQVEANEPSYWDEFKEWAYRRLGQAYSLACADGSLLDPVAAYAFRGYRAGRLQASAVPAAQPAGRTLSLAKTLYEAMCKAEGRSVSTPWDEVVEHYSTTRDEWIAVASAALAFYQAIPAAEPKP